MINDKVSDYFQASKELTAQLSEARRLKEHLLAGDDVGLLDRQIQHSASKVEELIELFTWETQDTDLIRRAFLQIAKNIIKTMSDAVPAGCAPSAIAMPAAALLLADIQTAMRKALGSRGRHVPRVSIAQGLAPEVYQLIETFSQDLVRQLRGATFDNLLEALTYFEKSMALLKLRFEAYKKTNGC